MQIKIEENRKNMESLVDEGSEILLFNQDFRKNPARKPVGLKKRMRQHFLLMILTVAALGIYGYLYFTGSIKGILYVILLIMLVLIIILDLIIINAGRKMPKVILQAAEEHNQTVTVDEKGISLNENTGLLWPDIFKILINQNSIVAMPKDIRSKYLLLNREICYQPFLEGIRENHQEELVQDNTK